MAKDPEIKQEDEQPDGRLVAGKDDPKQGEGRPYSGFSEPEDAESIDNSTEGRSYSGT